MEVANFNYNGKEYAVVLLNNNLQYGYKENGVFNTNLEKDEIDMMNYAMSKILISSDKSKHHKYGKTIHGGKIFQIMYDEISEKKFFYEIVGNEYKAPSFEDNIYLYEKFNLPKNYFANLKSNNKQEQDKKENRKTIKQKIKVYGTITTLSLSLGFAVFFRNKPLFKHIECIIVDSLYSNEQIKIEDLEKSLSSNNQLTEEEKDEFRKFYPMVEENKEYINPYLLKYYLKNYHIEYLNENHPFAAGQNYKLENCIKIYNKTSYESCIKDSYYRETLSHECCHTFHDFTIAGGLCEALTETFTSEYAKIATTAYYNERLCLYSLCEIINPDCFKEYYFKGDKRPIIKELTALIDNEDLAYELIGNIDSLFYNGIEEIKCKDKQEKQKIYKLQHELKEEIYDSISKYFTMKYSYPIEEDNVMMAYLCNSGFLPDKNVYNKNQDIREGYKTTNVFPKGYFSKEYKAKNQNVFLEQTNASEMKHTLKVKNINREEFLEKYQEKIEDKQGKRR